MTKDAVDNVNVMENVTTMATWTEVHPMAEIGPRVARQHIAHAAGCLAVVVSGSGCYRVVVFGERWTRRDPGFFVHGM